MPALPNSRRWSEFALIALVLAFLAGWLAPLGWPFELFVHFRLQLLVAAAALGILLLLLRRPVLAVVALGLALPLLVTSLHTGPVAVAAPSCGAMQIRVITANLQFSNHDHRRFSEWLLAHPADLVVAQEVTAAWAQSLRATAVGYPHSRIVAREDPYGMAVFSRWPMHVETVDLAVDGLPSMLVSLDAPDGPLQVLALHTRWPITPQLHLLRNRALDRAALLVRQDSARTLLVGDLNLTPYAPRFARLLRDSGLHDALAGQTWRATWRRGFWPLALPIDHVLVPPTTCVDRVEIGPDIGSDHRPLMAVMRRR